MEDHENTPESDLPVRLEFNAFLDGRSLPLWHYKSPPSGMRAAEFRDLYRGRLVLYRVELGPDVGEWYTDYVRASNYAALCRLVKSGAVLVK